MSKPEELGQVLHDIQARQRRRKRGRVCPWFRGQRVTDLDGTASQIPGDSQERQGETVDGVRPSTEGVGR